jgi:hypothetical protein
MNNLINFLKFFYAFTIFVLVLYLTDYFRVPSYFAINYDSESEYLAESIGYSINEYFVDFFHPGFTLKILGSLLYDIYKFRIIDEFIQYYRFIVFIIGFFLIYFYAINISFLSFAFISLYAFAVPLNFQLLGIISPHWVSLGVALYLYKYAINCLDLEENLKINFPKVIILINVALLTKFTFVVMIVPFVILFSFRILLFERQFVSFLSIILSANLILAFPFLLFVPLYLVIYLGINSKIMALGTILFSISLLFSYWFHSRLKIKSYDLKIFFTFIIKYLSAAIVFYSLLNSIFYDELPSDFIGRNLSFLGILSYVWFEDSAIKTKIKIFLLTLITLITIILHTYKTKAIYAAENIYYEIDKKFEHNISKILVENNIGTVLLYPTGKFISRKYFNSWSDFRYGARLNHLNIKSNFDLNENYYFILNSRKFGLENKPNDSKIVVKYLKFISSSSFGKRVGWPQQILNDQGGKNICEDPYDYYHHENYIVIRQNLEVNDIKELKDIRDALVNKCYLNVSDITRIHDNLFSIDYFVVRH